MKLMIDGTWRGDVTPVAVQRALKIEAITIFEAE